MQCNCGGETTDHKVIRNKKEAGEYAKCTSCGRVKWSWKSDHLSQELDAEQLDKTTVADGFAR